MWVSPWQAESAESTTLPVVGAAGEARRSVLPTSGSDPARELVDRAATGDVDAYAELLRRHRGRIHATATRMLGNAADADDVTQDVAIQLWTSLRGFTGGAAFTTWLHRIVVNRCLNHRRGDRSTEELLESHHPVASGPERQVLAAHELAEGLSVLAALPEDQRAVVVLVHLDGLTYQQVAATLRVSEGTVRGRLARARAELHRARSTA